MLLKGLKLGKVAPTATPADAKGRARAKVVAHLEQQKQLLAAHLEGKALNATRPVYRTNEIGERVRVMQPVHVRRSWFEDTAGTVHFMVWCGTAPSHCRWTRPAAPAWRSAGSTRCLA